MTCINPFLTNEIQFNKLHPVSKNERVKKKLLIPHIRATPLRTNEKGSGVGENAITKSAFDKSTY